MPEALHCTGRQAIKGGAERKRLCRAADWRSAPKGTGGRQVGVPARNGPLHDNENDA